MAEPKSLTEKYRLVFDSPTGREVLVDLLAGMGFFQLEETSPEALVLHNQAKIIMQKCGFFEYENWNDLIDGWFRLAVDRGNE